jgi:hypothetical protein
MSVASSESCWSIARGPERNYGAVAPIDICHACGGLWFDKWENLALTPGSVLRLVVVINGNQPAQRNPLGNNLACPRRRGRAAQGERHLQ